MPISAEVKMFVAGLGNDEVWKKMPLDEEPNYTFINDLEEQIYTLVGGGWYHWTYRLDNASGGISNNLKYNFFYSINTPVYSQLPSPNKLHYH